MKTGLLIVIAIILAMVDHPDMRMFLASKVVALGLMFVLIYQLNR